MQRDIELDANESRVLGVLIEKSLTTPDQYPLTLNSATVGSNQKSNRSPVLLLDEEEVAGALARLEGKYLVRRVYPGNSRVEKYVHTTKEATGLEVEKQAILAELLMRGPQTLGELRARASRMAEIPTLDALNELLQAMIEEGYVERLPPLPGSRAERIVQKVSPDLHPVEPGVAPSAVAAAPARSSAINELTERVERLEDEVARLREMVERLTS